jgi:hypothetical protein
MCLWDLKLLPIFADWSLLFYYILFHCMYHVVFYFTNSDWWPVSVSSIFSHPLNILHNIYISCFLTMFVQGVKCYEGSRLRKLPLIDVEILTYTCRVLSVLYNMIVYCMCHLLDFISRIYIGVLFTFIKFNNTLKYNGTRYSCILLINW